jgi:hypothetical protein
MARRTRRVRHEPPKVWHNPEVVGPRGRGRGQPPKSTPDPVRDDGAQEATPTSRVAPRSGRIVTRVAGALDERTLERDRLLGKLRAAEGRPAITRAANELFKASFELPEDDQHVHLQLLEHTEEARVRDAIARLATILEQEPPKRFAVLDSRLRRLEEFADEAETRDAATAMRKRIKSAGTAASA